MSVITWPATLRVPAECSISQARYDMVEASDATGHQSARLFGPPRWRMALRSVDAFTLAEAGQWEALLLQLRGGVNHLAVWDPVRTEPQGSIRGSPVLNATAAAGAASLVLGKCTTPQNMLLTPSFEIDTDANGLADDWTIYDDGTAGTVTASANTTSTASGVRAQKVSATAMNVTSASVAGVYQTVEGIVAGNAYTLSVYELSVTNCTIGLEFRWRNAGGGIISSSVQNFASVTSAYWLHQFTATAPALATQVSVILFMHSNASLGAAEVNFDLAQLEVSGAYTAAAPSPTLLAGDWLQVGTPGVATSQLVKVVANATATGNSLMTVTFEPPLRQQFAAGTVVTWDKPLGYFKQTGEPQWSYRPGIRMKQSGFALDLLEAFS